VHDVPFESNLQTQRHAILSQALNPTIVNGMVFAWKQIQQVLTIHNPMPATGAPVGVGRPVINFLRLGFVLAGVHGKSSSAKRPRANSPWFSPHHK
jgi:hypothetical protein